MAIRDDILEAIEQDVRPLLLDEVWSDPYLIERTVTVTDDAGDPTSTTSTVESGVCSLKPATGSERVQASQLQWVAAYTVRLPYDTLLTPDDDLVVAGRRYEVGAVMRGGEFAVSTTALCQETS